MDRRLPIVALLVAATLAHADTNKTSTAPTAYRLLAIYEKTAERWKLGSARFSLGR